MHSCYIDMQEWEEIVLVSFRFPQNQVNIGISTRTWIHASFKTYQLYNWGINQQWWRCEINCATWTLMVCVCVCEENRKGSNFDLFVRCWCYHYYFCCVILIAVFFLLFRFLCPSNFFFPHSRSLSSEYTTYVCAVGFFLYKATTNVFQGWMIGKS